MQRALKNKIPAEWHNQVRMCFLKVSAMAEMRDVGLHMQWASGSRRWTRLRRWRPAASSQTRSHTARSSPHPTAATSGAARCRHGVPPATPLFCACLETAWLRVVQAQEGHIFVPRLCWQLGGLVSMPQSATTQLTRCCAAMAGTCVPSAFVPESSVCGTRLCAGAGGDAGAGAPAGRGRVQRGHRGAVALGRAAAAAQGRAAVPGALQVQA